MAYLGTISGSCGADESPRTGIGNCPVQQGKTMALLVTGLNALFPIDEALFIDALPNYPSASGALRMFPIRAINGNTPSGGDVVTVDEGTYGETSPSHINAPVHVLQVKAGDCLYKELSILNKRQMRVFMVDDAGMIYGTVVMRNGEKFFAGFKATLYTPPATIPDGSNPYVLAISVYFSNEYEAERKNLQGFSIGMENVPDGLIGVKILAKDDQGNISVVTGCGGEDVTSDFGNNWDVSMFLTETGSSPTSAAFDASTGLIKLAPSGSYRVAPADVLAAGDIFGVDGLPEYVEVTAPTA